MPKKCKLCAYKSLLHMECPACGGVVCQGCWVWEVRKCYRCFRQRPEPLKRVVGRDFVLDEDEPVANALF